MRARVAIAVLLAGLAGPALPDPGAASAGAYSQVLQAYQATGSIPACRFSSARLAAALKGLDAYGQQYFADFTDAVSGALAAQAAGACAGGSHPRSDSVAAPQSPLPPSPSAPTGADVPLPLLALAGLTLILALLVAGGALARSAGWEPPWAAGWRHGWAEAGERLSLALADLADRRRRP